MRQIVGILVLIIIILGVFTYYGQADVPLQVDKIRVDTKSVNIRARTYGGTEILGEVVNETAYIVGFVTVTITLKDALGKVLDTDYTYVRGKNVEITGTSTDSGIYPGERAPFSETFTQTEANSIKSVTYTVAYQVAGPRTDIPETPIHTRLAQVEAATKENRTLIDALKAQVASLASRPSGSGLLGDLDNDRDVDFQDFLVFARNFGKTI